MSGQIPRPYLTQEEVEAIESALHSHSPEDQVRVTVQLLGGLMSERKRFYEAWLEERREITNQQWSELDKALAWIREVSRKAPAPWAARAKGFLAGVSERIDAEKQAAFAELDAAVEDLK